MNSKLKYLVLPTFSAVLALSSSVQADLISFDPTGSGHGIANVALIDQAPGNALVERIGASNFLLHQYEANLISMGFSDSTTAFINGSGGNYFTFVADTSSFAMYAASAPGDSLTGTGFETDKPILQAHVATAPWTLLSVISNEPVNLDQSSNGNQLGLQQSVFALGISTGTLVVDSVNSGYFPTLKPGEGLAALINSNLETPFRQVDPNLSWAGMAGPINGTGSDVLLQMDSLMTLMAAPGISPLVPILPVMDLPGGLGWELDFPITTDAPLFVDPAVATGFDYFSDSGPNFTSVILPHIGDGEFALYLWNGIDWQFDTTLAAGIQHSFGVSGVDRFRITGIETSAGLDPNSVTAFVTGLTFSGTGQESMRMVPITQEISVVSEPGTLAAIMMGVGVMGLMVRCRRIS